MTQPGPPATYPPRPAKDPSASPRPASVWMKAAVSDEPLLGHVAVRHDPEPPPRTAAKSPTRVYGYRG
jgi:hypothetical protein